MSGEPERQDRAKGRRIQSAESERTESDRAELNSAESDRAELSKAEPEHVVLDLNLPTDHLSSGKLPDSPPLEDGPDDPSEPLLVIPELTTMFPSSAPFLARFLPHVAPSVLGLNASFCNLHDFLRHLHDVGWYGYLHAFIGDQAAFVLVYEGRTVAAASISSTGEQALGELLHLYEQGAPLSAYPLPPHLAHILSGVGSRAWKFNLTEDFTGLHARPRGAIFYSRGEIVATMPATLPYEGAFPAPLRPQTLILPRSLAGWAHGQYGLTLRGKDALNAITSVHQSFRAQHGTLGLAFLRALADKLSPAEYAMRTDVALHDLEPLLQEFLRTGVAKEQLAG